MDPHLWKKPWSRLFKGKAIEVDIPYHKYSTKEETTLEVTPKFYFNLTIRCMKQVDRVSSAQGSSVPKFNKEQCKYLAIKLQLAIQTASPIIDKINTEFLSLVEPHDKAQLLGIFKLLYATGVEVDALIQSCCKESWIQSAIMLMNMSELFASIGVNLKVCTIVFSTTYMKRKHSFIDFDAARIRQVEVEIVKEKADLDEAKLILNMKNIIESNPSSSPNWQLAKFLLGRLETVTLHPSSTKARFEDQNLPSVMTSLKQMQDCLGRGAFGSVYKAMWLGVEVAKKTFYGPNTTDFLQEVAILDGLNHPNVVSLLWYMSDEKRCHLVMELMDGDLFTLMQQRMEENGSQGCPFSIPEALDLILQIGEGMLYLHEKRIVHRDLKSHNILIRCGKVAKENVKYLHLKVADFGLSKTKEHSATYTDLTLNVGTRRWMAPEVMRVDDVRHDDVDKEREVALNYPFKIDIYSFGMVCYEILTGEVPFSSLSHGEVKKAVLSGERPPLPRECPYRLRTLIESCWSIEASMRPNFGNICEELRDLKYENLLAYWETTIYQCPLEDGATIDELVAIGPIIAVLMSSHMKAREKAAETLMNISSDLVGKIRENIRNPDVVHALVKLLQHGSTKGKEYAAILLFKTCHSQKDYASAIRAGIVPPLMNLIVQQSSTMLDDALMILARLAMVREGLIAIAEVGPTPVLVQFIASESRTSRWNIDRAAAILSRLCLHDPRFVREARESNVVERLAVLAQDFFYCPSARVLLQLLREPKVDDLQLQ